VTTYDSMVLADSPTLYLALGSPNSAENSLVGDHLATFSGNPGTTTLPNGDQAALFDGTLGQYIQVPDADDLSVPTTGALTIEAWLRPDSLVFPAVEGTGYVHWLGKLNYGPNACEWVARIYSQGNTENRANRLSGYCFNPAGGLGAGSYTQDTLTPGQWIHYALVINTAPSPTYPTGYTKLYRGGVLRDQDALADYSIVPANTTAPVRIGSATGRSAFLGGIGKVAIYPAELAADRIAEHHRVMNSAQ
jgi:hypothetical protein